MKGSFRLIFLSSKLFVFLVSLLFLYLQAIDCLVSNAIKFTETGSVEISVSFTEFSEEDKVNFAASAPLKLSACFEGKEPMGTFQVAVRDTGVGVSPQDIPQLFQPFIQLDASSTRRFGGMGLGLSLSKEVKFSQKSIFFSALTLILYVWFLSWLKF